MGWKAPDEHQIANARKPEELARPKDFERPQEAFGADLFAMHMKGCEDIGVEKMVWNVQATQHARQHAAAAKGDHVNSAGTDLNALKGFRGEAATTVR